MVSCLIWIYYEPSLQGEVIIGVNLYIPYYHHFKVAPIFPQDVFTSCPHQYALSHLIPRIHVPESPVLTELVEEVHQPKLHRHISDLLTAGVLGLAYVSIEVP